MQLMYALSPPVPDSKVVSLPSCNLGAKISVHPKSLHNLVTTICSSSPPAAFPSKMPPNHTPRSMVVSNSGLKPVFTELGLLVEVLQPILGSTGSNVFWQQQ